MTYIIRMRNRIKVNTDPHRRCYNGLLNTAITQLQELEACVESLDTWKKETLTKLNSKETIK